MKIDHVVIDSLMTWAKAHAPLSGWVVNGERQRRRVRIEITAEYNQITSPDTWTICRVYLAHPGEDDGYRRHEERRGNPDYRCLAETRIA